MNDKERTALCRRIDELCAENERLRQENQSIGVAAYELGRKSMADENAKLREMALYILHQHTMRELSAGTCHADETDTIKCWIKSKDEPSTEHIEIIHVMECSVCGGTYEYINGNYEFCPRCSRKVVVDE